MAYKTDKDLNMNKTLKKMSLSSFKQEKVQQIQLEINKSIYKLKHEAKRNIGLTDYIVGYSSKLSKIILEKSFFYNEISQSGAQAKVTLKFIDKLVD